MITDNQVYTKISKALKIEYSDILVTAESTATPSKFPCVFIEEMDSYSLEQYETFSNDETHRESVFEVQAYSNKTSGAKQEIKEIVDFIHKEFRKLGYRCTTNRPVANADPSVKRRVARFTRIIGSEDKLPK